MSATGHNLRRRRAAQAVQTAKARDAEKTAAVKAAGVAPAPEPEPAHTFNLTGPWMKKRAEVRDALGAESVPASKDEARQWLADAGYQVEG